MENQYNQPQFTNTPLNSLPNATAVLVLGIVSIVTCFCYGFIGLTCGIIALYLAGKDKRLYAHSPASYTPSSYNNLKAGRVCALIGVILSAIYLAIIIVYLVIFGAVILHNPQDIFRHMQS